MPIQLDPGRREVSSHRSVLILVEGGEVPGPPGATGYSGFIRYIAGSIPYIQEAGYRVLFGSLRGRTPLHPVIEDLGCRTFALDAGGVATYPLAATRLARIIRKERPDVLHLYESIQATVGGVAGAIARHRARIFHRHHTIIEGQSAAFTRLASRLTHRTMAVSNAVAGLAKTADRVSPERICVAYNGVPDPRPVAPAEVSELRARLGIAPNALCVGIVGHLRPEKGHKILIDALGGATRILDRPLHLLVVGSGPEAENLRNRAAAVPNLSAHFVGHQTDVYPWYALSDVVAVPSVRESFGLTAVEAMACARPLVAARVEGLEEVVGEDGGLLFEAGDADELARCITALLTGADRAQQLGRSARARYERHFTVEAMVAAWIECYETALRG